MLIDYLVSAVQVMAFGFIASGCVLCLWGVALDTREERAREAEEEERLSGRENALQRLEAGAALAKAIAATRAAKPRPLFPMAAGFGIRQAGSIKIR